MPDSLYLDLDGAWGESAPAVLGHDARVLRLRDWGPLLRYHAKADDVASLREVLPADSRYVLYGSGDFHHIAGMLLSRVIVPGAVLVSFDNHPDWDIRPPAWSCGGWVHRALKQPMLERAVVWGCGNFELRSPSRWWASRGALRSGRLQINAWAERQKGSVARRFNCMTRDNWQQRFEDFCRSIARRPLYVTVDLDALREDKAVTNWESGLYTSEEVAWAIRQLREHARFLGADLCGARSTPTYARAFQRFAGTWDHPPIPAVAPATAIAINLRALETIWPALSD